MASAQAALPQNFPAILKDADSQIDPSSTEEVFKQLQSGVFLKQNTEMSAKNLTYVGGVWKWYKDGNVEVAELTSGKRFVVTGNFHQTCKLSPAVNYDVYFLIKMKDYAEGWNNPVTMEYVLPNGTKKKITPTLSDQPREKWLQIHIGHFDTAAAGMSGVMTISLSSSDDQEKKGLVIREIDITPRP